MHKGTRIQTGLLVFVLALPACSWFGPAELPPPSPCDPVANIYSDGQHFISRDYVTEDGTMDYARWFESRRIQASPCDPTSKATPKASVPVSPNPTGTAPVALPEPTDMPPAPAAKHSDSTVHPGEPAGSREQPRQDSPAPGTMPKKNPPR